MHRLQKEEFTLLTFPSHAKKFYDQRLGFTNVQLCNWSDSKQSPGSVQSSHKSQFNSRCLTQNVKDNEELVGKEQ